MTTRADKSIYAVRCTTYVPGPGTRHMTLEGRSSDSSSVGQPRKGGKKKKKKKKTREAYITLHTYLTCFFLFRLCYTDYAYLIPNNNNANWFGRAVLRIPLPCCGLVIKVCDLAPLSFSASLRCHCDDLYLRFDPVPMRVRIQRSGLWEKAKEKKLIGRNQQNHTCICQFGSVWPNETRGTEST
ncbi:hypothetical protein GGR53DRAFT_7272 [Hypoxylon sp. FL1150]|nr:hypothetical protein GGR53DRAFT_7272 [Hypoxylon sp. FL1150]